MKIPVRPKNLLPILSLTALALFGCSSGKTVVNTVSYYSVPSEDNINYYRVNIAAKGTLSKYNYASGWYPTNALDQLFGKVSDDEAVESIAIQKTLRKQYNDAIVAMSKKWLDAATDPNSTKEQLELLMLARRRMLAYPAPGGSPFNNAIEVEYNPEKGMALLHSDEKFVIIVSANPDEVVGKISSFSESDKTTAQINKISQFFQMKNKADLLGKKAEFDVTSQQTKDIAVVEIANVQKAVTDKSLTKAQTLTEIDSFIEILKALQ